MSGGAGPRLLANGAAQLVLLAGLFAERLLLVPLFVAAWGVPAYSAWLQLVAVTGLLSVLDQGLSLCLGNHIHEAEAAGARARALRLMGTGITVSALLLGPAAVVAVIAASAIDWTAWFGGGGAAPPELAATAACLGLLVLARVAETVLAGAFRGFRLYTRALCLCAAGQCALIVVTALALAGGWPMAAVAGAQSAVECGIVIFLLLDLRRRIGSDAVRPLVPDGGELQKFAAGSWPYIVPMIGNAVNVHVAVLAVGVLVATPVGVVVFTLTRTLAGTLRQGIAQVALSLADEIAGALHRRDDESASRLFAVGNRVLGGLAGLGAALLLYAGEPLVRVLTGGAVQPDGRLLMLLAAGAVLGVPGQIVNAICLFSNRGKALARVVGLWLAGLALLLPALTAWKGLEGTGAALVASELLGFVLALPPLAGLVLPLRYWRGAFSGYCRAIVVGALGYAAAYPAEAVAAPVSAVGLMAFLAVWALMIALPAAFLILDPEQRRRLRRALTRRR